MLSGIDVGTLGASGVAAVAVLSVFFGWLTPKRFVDALERDRDAWRDATTISQTAIKELTEQNKLLLKQGELTLAVVQALRTQSPPGPEVLT